MIDIYRIFFIIINITLFISIVALTILIFNDTLKRKLSIFEIIAWTIGSVFLFPVVPLLYYYFRKKSII